jgi:F0F1-type ATP synthase beta subunit
VGERTREGNNLYRNERIKVIDADNFEEIQP